MKKVLPPQPSSTGSSAEENPSTAGIPSSPENALSESRLQHLQEQPQQSNFSAINTLPHEFMQILGPSLKVGAVTGTLGLFTGSVVSILRYSPHPVAWSISTSLHWFVLGSSYYGTRLTTLALWGRQEKALSQTEKIQASAIAGGVAGATGGLLVGRGHIVPGLILWSIIGAAGQTIFNEMQTRYAASKTGKEKSWLDSKWSPMHKMTDQEYHSYLQEKILSIEAEISVIDDNIRDLRASKNAKRPSEVIDK